MGGPDCILEREPMEDLAREGQLMAYQHDGFFYAMDTYREYQYLNELWASEQTPWKVWAMNHFGGIARLGHRRRPVCSGRGSSSN